MKLMETLFFPTQVWYNYVQRTPGKAHVFYGMNTGNIRVFTRMRKTSKRKGKCSVKECRGQPINGTLEQAVINGNF